MIVIGECIIGLAATPNRRDADYYISLVLASAAVYLIARIFFNSQPMKSDIMVHAMDDSAQRGVFRSVFQFIMSFGVLCFGKGIDKVLDIDETYYRDRAWLLVGGLSLAMISLQAMKMTDVYTGSPFDSRTYHLRSYRYHNELFRRRALMVVQSLLAVGMVPLPLLFTTSHAEGADDLSYINQAALMAILLSFLIVHSLLDAFFGGISEAEHTLLQRKKDFADCPASITAFLDQYRDSQFEVSGGMGGATISSTTFGESNTDTLDREPLTPAQRARAQENWNKVRGVIREYRLRRMLMHMHPAGRHVGGLQQAGRLRREQNMFSDFLDTGAQGNRKLTRSDELSKSGRTRFRWLSQRKRTTRARRESAATGSTATPHSWSRSGSGPSVHVPPSHLLVPIEEANEGDEGASSPRPRRSLFGFLRTFSNRSSRSTRSNPTQAAEAQNSPGTSSPIDGALQDSPARSSLAASDHTRTRTPPDHVRFEISEFDDQELQQSRRTTAPQLLPKSGTALDEVRRVQFPRSSSLDTPSSSGVPTVIATDSQTLLTIPPPLIDLGVPVSIEAIEPVAIGSAAAGDPDASHAAPAPGPGMQGSSASAAADPPPATAGQAIATPTGAQGPAASGTHTPSAGSLLSLLPTGPDPKRKSMRVPMESDV
eukprot:m.25984 g.25984  ORF g.25984 m.25984 type:complete len:655 (+) comp4227_c0_seq1:119-2083(+)